MLRKQVLPPQLTPIWGLVVMVLATTVVGVAALTTTVTTIVLLDTTLEVAAKKVATPDEIGFANSSGDLGLIDYQWTFPHAVR